ncbi:2-(1,2-epoxy-1,2-dihydrophenyl)acetyl-CoA isomerase [Oceanobacillus limi]|uniref:2-(1,2-epoxy-1,2-dihydrophenyl)acetyl-CoA isomerase n=1 Tax=Oceanobacillus limi TaxID=930131 RepID=A0A1I0F5G8_9BACI|nr:enoyl-CoA hydratase-related protein [Oceanobacillus limi]SET53076.1 2-(1,2-epoxy-1,2-dihydrophenyl)acetyl-CoA isomerase [Oceanobacillus limi]
MEFQTIRYEVNDKVATITLNRPSAYNAMTEAMNKEITTALKVAGKDSSVRCVEVTGEGKAFCSGQDLVDVEESTNHADFLRERYHPMIRAMKQTPKPIIAAINGTAAGAGMSLALAADFRMMKSQAKLVSAFMNVGLVPDSGFMYLLPRIIGYSKALEVATLGKPITGEEALEMGLISELVEPSDWEEKRKTFASQLAALPTKSFSLIKRYMLDSMNHDISTFLEQEAHAQRIAGMSDDHQEGLTAFAEKRKARFSGS